MQAYDFWWEDDNIEHIANHGVEPYEAEEVITNQPRLKHAGDGKYFAYGQTDAGRYLLVVYAPKSGRRVRVVTARDMTPTEKRALRHK